MTSSPMYFASPSRGGCPEYSSRARFGSLPREGSPEYSAMTKLGSSPRGNAHEMARLENSLGKVSDAAVEPTDSYTGDYSSTGK